MAYSLAVFITWGAFLVDGNHLTNWMSIGEKTAETGLAPPPPAIVGGLNTHKVFEGASYPHLFFRISSHAKLPLVEGDASTTRGDFYFGNNFSFNETLFDQVRFLLNVFLYCTAY